MWLTCHNRAQRLYKAMITATFRKAFSDKAMKIQFFAKFGTLAFGFLNNYPLRQNIFYNFKNHI